MTAYASPAELVVLVVAVVVFGPVLLWGRLSRKGEG